MSLSNAADTALNFIEDSRLKGLNEAIETTFPSTTVQTCHRSFDPQQPGLSELGEPAHAALQDHQDSGHFPSDEAATKLLRNSDTPLGTAA